MSLEIKIGIAALVFTIIGVIIAWLQLRKKDPPTTSLKQSPVEGSAIISGSYNQVLIHPAPVSPQPLPPKAERPKANIRYIDASTIFLGDRSDEKRLENAIVIRFANDARPGMRNVEVSVKATVIYFDGEKEICAVTGYWMDENRDYARFKVDGRYTLLAGRVMRDELQAPTKYRTFAHNREYFQEENEPVINFKTGILLVRLTDENTGEWLDEKKFRITLNPLSIEPIEERKLLAFPNDGALADEILSYARLMKQKHPNRVFEESALCLEFGVTAEQVARAMDILHKRGRAERTGHPGTWFIRP